MGFTGPYKVGAYAEKGPKEVTKRFGHTHARSNARTPASSAHAEATV